jgi:hypothetical protein
MEASMTQRLSSAQVDPAPSCRHRRRAAPGPDSEHPERPGMKDITRIDFAHRAVALGVEKPGYASVTTCGLLMDALLRNRSQWTLPALVSMFDGTHGDQVRGSTWTSAFEGCRSDVTVNGTLTLAARTGFARLCIRSRRIDVLRTVLAMPVPEEFTAFVDEVTAATTPAGRFLDRLTWERHYTRNQQTSALEKGNFLVSLRNEHHLSAWPTERNEFMDLALVADPDHPAIQGLRTTTFGRHLMEAVMRVRLQHELARAPVEAAAPSHRRRRLGL